MASLYNREKRNEYIWQVYKLDDRAKPPKTLYATDPSSDWNTTKLKHTHGQVDDTGSPMGKYDNEGWYCTRCAAVPGSEGANAVQRYIKHPLASEQDKLKWEAEQISKRHS